MFYLQVAFCSLNYSISIRRWREKKTIIRLFNSATQSVCFQPEPSQTSHIPSNQTVLLPVQNRCLPNAEGAAGVRPLTAGIPQALAGLASHQHRGDVVNLISGLGAGALLGLRDPTTFTPAPAGVEDQDQTQDGQQKGDHPALRGGGWHLEQRCTKKGMARGGKKSREATSKGRMLPSLVSIKVKPTVQYEERLQMQLNKEYLECFRCK